MIRNSNKKVFLCIAVSIILVISLMAFASAAQGSNSGFFEKIINFFKVLFGGKVAGHAVEGACETVEGVNPIVPADACCVSDGVFRDTACLNENWSKYAYEVCVSKYIFGADVSWDELKNVLDSLDNSNVLVSSACPAGESP